MPDRERKDVPDPGSIVLKALSPRVLLPILGTRNIRVSDAVERRGRERERERESNSERYRRAVPETMWKQMRAILYSIQWLIGNQWRSQSKEVMWKDLTKMTRVNLYTFFFK